MAAASLALILLFLRIITSSSATSDHRYNAGDPVPLYAYKIGPFHNPVETYRYFDLAFCSSEAAIEEKETLGQVLDGGRIVVAPHKIEFLVDLESGKACKKRLKREDVAKFRDAVQRDYYFQMFLDGLPIWGFLGRFEHESYIDTVPSKRKYFLFKRLDFVIFYNGDHVIECNIYTKSDALVDITEDREMEVEFQYSVKWKETNISFEKRLEKYSVYHSAYGMKIQLFSTMTSCVLVLLLTGLLATVLVRVVKNDLAKYASHEDLIPDQEETGWKNIHGDVFRYPKNKSLLAASLGSGTRLVFVFTSMLVIGLLGVFPPYNQGSFLTSIIVIYALSSVLAGYTSTSFYCQLEGTNWVKNLIMTEFLFSGPLFVMFCFLNTVASIYNANAAMSFGTILVLLIWILLGSSLLVLGGIAAKNRKIEFEAPCQTTKCPREIPPLRWYQGSIPKMAIAGILPFSTIYVQLYYILSSVWGLKHYTMYGILLIVFIILLIVTAFVTVALTYFQLASEDYQWWWSSLFYGGSTGIIMYGYCGYFYYARTAMNGFMQTSFFLGYMACICYGIFLMLGTVGFRASLLFVRQIYGTIKCE
ncbi:hypothetical protein J5N97_009483 [Dioscorea zingiberensis]|uniref:Transmembrane 9 superfamily member n=1 Tax=Dioscorea zingiberensis TaxID=325984 RepID=A0A9D5HLV4_9LILI|nr:hypothetical protein J5N97_009483 [Dioscorea zingiberensis]